MFAYELFKNYWHILNNLNISQIEYSQYNKKKKNLIILINAAWYAHACLDSIGKNGF